ncbi:barstar family protein [Roseivirga thermotolerans]|uniref:phosphoribosylanthranilate isomerase n=1 Tax=Roseivirga thermotolerans TaxID=1758176 RepID=UPI00273E4A71|nr:barstar family protein [Roseivirga thermotolerans]
MPTERIGVFGSQFKAFAEKNARLLSSYEELETWALSYKVRFDKSLAIFPVNRKVVEISGNEINSIKTFYDAIEKELISDRNWGRNFNALRDIIMGGFGKTEYGQPFTLMWKNHLESRRAMKTDFDDIIALIKEFQHVELQLPNGMSDLKLKVCGMRESHNIGQLLELRPDFMGFIFFERSKRFAPDLDKELLLGFPETTKKVGVFVNAPIQQVKEKVRQYKLDYVQLHGDESVEYVGELFAIGIKVIKVFSVGDKFDFDRLKPYKGLVDFFLFDTKGKERGGNGVVFNWEVLNDYSYDVPYFLSGGIDLENLEDIAHIKVQPYAIDVNSKFELEPGLKDIVQVKMLKEILK